MSIIIFSVDCEHGDVQDRCQRCGRGHHHNVCGRCRSGYRLYDDTRMCGWGELCH